MSSRCKIIHYDINSPEWKEKIANLQKQIEARNDPFSNELYSPGYIKRISKHVDKRRR